MLKFKIIHGTYTAEGTSATIKCNGKTLQEDIVIEAVEVEEVKFISFTVGRNTYQAVEGMTWAEWCDSEYNTGGFRADSGGNVFLSTGLERITNPNGSYVQRNDEIIADRAYKSKHSGGGAD